jgi:pseudouridine-5'-phosphate glycosidase
VDGSAFADDDVTTIAAHPDVTHALDHGEPVVALESAVITCGLPRTPLGRVPDIPSATGDPEPAPGWRPEAPVNLETGRLLERIIRAAGALPATVAVLDGRLHIGLTDEQLDRLATDQLAGKVASRDLAGHLSATNARTAGTTVSATLHACTLAQPRPISVMATGGIGGVHRGWTQIPDLSSDLLLLSRSRVCVVCAGTKTVLDGQATLEALETLSVPVIGYRTRHFARFLTVGTDPLPETDRLETAQDVARRCGAHWDQLECPSAIVVAQALAAPFALEPDALEVAIQTGQAQAAAQDVRGAQATPFLLAKLIDATGGDSLKANVALLAQNARLAAEVAIELAGRSDA